MSTVCVDTPKGLQEFVDTESEIYEFEIGQENGVLIIVRKIEVQSVISVPDTEEVVKAFGDGAWDEVYRV